MIITLSYLIVSTYKHTKPDINLQTILVVCMNLVITEVCAQYDNFSNSFSIINFIAFFLTQDVYFYTIHYLLHKYAFNLHSMHHNYYGAFFAWYAHPLDHIILNIGSFGFSFWMFPNPYYVYIGLIILQIYTSVNGHTEDSKHSRHHRNMTQRLGSIYIMDSLFGSYV